MSIPLKGGSGDEKYVAGPDGRHTARGMAHFAGSGPPGKHCYDCQLFRMKVRKSGKGFCAKYVEMMSANLLTASNKKPPQFASHMRACKHFMEIQAK